MMPTGMNDSTKFPFVAFRRQEKEFYKQAATPTDSRCASSEVERFFKKNIPISFVNFISDAFFSDFLISFVFLVFALQLVKSGMRGYAGAERNGA